MSVVKDIYDKLGLGFENFKRFSNFLKDRKFFLLFYFFVNTVLCYQFLQERQGAHLASTPIHRIQEKIPTA